MITILRSVGLIVSLAAGLVLAGATIAGAAPAPPASTKTEAHLVPNRGFEHPVCSSSCTFSAGSTAIPHWAVGGGSIDIVSASWWQPAGGSQSVDLAGVAPGSLTQDVATTAGTTYILRWHMAGNPEGGPKVKVMKVYWDGTLVRTCRFDTTGHTDTSMGWVRRQITVTATGPTSSIEFADATPHATLYGAALDRVALLPWASHSHPRYSR
jgi:choice-of-anchor C domain-containing protein